MFNIDEIKQQFIEVIKFSQGIKEPKVDELFSKWIEAKRYFINAMDGELRLCIPNIKFDLGEAERSRRLEAFLNHLDEDYDLYSLVNFIQANRSGFFENKVVHIPFWMCVVDTDIPRDEYKGIQLGMKLIRCFKYFINDKVFLEQIQNEASLIIQEDKIEGNLYLSVHPLDFLSSSENTYNWRSCHALDGEYRCGNLSYMCDSSTIMCYLATEDKVLPRFPQDVKWNSKKWRMLLHFSDNWDMIFAGRHYPFFSKGIMDYVLNSVIAKSKLSNKNYWWSEWTNYNIRQVYDDNTNEECWLNEKYIPISGELRALKDIVKDARNSKHYNDILYSSCYIPYYTKRRQRDPFDEVYDRVCLPELVFNLGSKTTCLHCGERHVHDYNMMVCSKCDLDYYHFDDDEEYVECICCGVRMYRDFASFDGYDNFVCEDCLQEEYERCSRCHSWYTHDDMIYHRKYGNRVCRFCYEDMEPDDDE